MWDIHKGFRLILLEIEYFHGWSCMIHILAYQRSDTCKKDHFADKPKQESQGLIIHNIEVISLVG